MCVCGRSVCVHFFFEAPRWFSREQIQDHISPGNMVWVVLGSWCWICGTALETWPQHLKEDCNRKIQTDPVFAVEFNATRAGVEKAFEKLFKFVRPETVTRNKEIGGRLIRRLAFIEKDVFNDHFGVLPGDQGTSAKMVTVPGFEGYDVDGGVLRTSNVPANLEHDILEIYANDSRDLHRVMLAPQQQFREGQATDRWLFACKSLASRRGPHLRGMPTIAPHYHAVKLEANALQVKLALANAAGGEGGASKNASVTVTSSTLDDDDMPAAARAGAGGGVGSGVQAAGGGVSKKRRAEPSFGGTRRSAGKWAAGCLVENVLGPPPGTPAFVGGPAPGTPGRFGPAPATPAPSARGAAAPGTPGGFSSVSKIEVDILVPTARIDIEQILWGASCGRELRPVTPNIICVVCRCSNFL